MSNKSLETSVVLQGDCIEMLKTLPDKSVDLVFADPPYNLQLKGDLWRPNNTKVSAVNDDRDKYNSFCNLRRFYNQMADGVSACTQRQRHDLGYRLIILWLFVYRLARNTNSFVINKFSYPCK